MTEKLALPIRGVDGSWMGIYRLVCYSFPSVKTLGSGASVVYILLFLYYFNSIFRLALHPIYLVVHVMWVQRHAIFFWKISVLSHELGECDRCWHMGGSKDTRSFPWKIHARDLIMCLPCPLKYCPDDETGEYEQRILPKQCSTWIRDQRSLIDRKQSRKGD
jgi:hypothetical protein